MKTLSNLLSTLIMLFILSFTLPVICRETKAFFYWKYVELRGGYVMVADGSPEVVIPPIFHADPELDAPLPEPKPIVIPPDTIDYTSINYDTLQMVGEPRVLTASPAPYVPKLYWPPMY